jgi:aminopeptidase-like protein
MTPDGAALHDLVRRLYPITRSITGQGVRDTLAEIGHLVPLTITEVPSGTPVLDWTVPQEWNVRAAFIEDVATGTRVVDIADSNLHLVSYSTPVDAVLTMDELRPHLHSLPEHPSWIPYRTSYYREDWGFCLAHDRQTALAADGRFHVRIDSTLTDGSLTYAECVLPGEVEDEVLLSTHVCHPSLANDNLSAIAVATYLAQALAAVPHRYTYRFLFAPGTIGAITWLATHEDDVARIRHGLTLACLGDRGGPTYKRSRRGDAAIDRVVEYTLARRPGGGRVVDFTPYGYDERQYGSPGYDLAVGSLTRTPYGAYREYHTSADDLDFVTPEALADSLALAWEIVILLERDRTYRNLSPRGEPQLGRRGLYPGTGGGSIPAEQHAMLWVLNQSDGEHSLLDVARRSGLDLDLLAGAAERLVAAGLLAQAD